MSDLERNKLLYPSLKELIEGMDARPEKLARATNINVPYADKDKVKEMGAKWDAKKKTWYVPQGLYLHHFKKWLK